MKSIQILLLRDTVRDILTLEKRTYNNCLPFEINFIPMQSFNLEVRLIYYKTKIQFSHKFLRTHYSLYSTNY
jgi:hypothetical protein